MTASNYDPSPEHRKRFGQYFTPPRIASLMCDWCLGANPTSVLDPSTGTGNLLTPFISSGRDLDIMAFDLDIDVLRHFAHSSDRVRPVAADFLRSPLKKYDAITMNPPYIRHRDLHGRDEDRARISSLASVAIPKNANLYVYFCVKASLELNAGGRAAFLIPSEWMNANFTSTFKDFLLSRDLLKEIVIFSGSSSVFVEALTTASVLFLEQRS